MSTHVESSGKYYILTNYICYAMREATYSDLNDGSVCGRIPGFAGLIAFAPSSRECRRELRAALEGWLVMKLKMGQVLPEIHGINLNGGPSDADSGTT